MAIERTMGHENNPYKRLDIKDFDPEKINGFKSWTYEVTGTNNNRKEIAVPTSWKFQLVKGSEVEIEFNLGLGTLLDTAFHAQSLRESSPSLSVNYKNGTKLLFSPDQFRSVPDYYDSSTGLLEFYASVNNFPCFLNIHSSGSIWSQGSMIAVPSPITGERHLV